MSIKFVSFGIIFSLKPFLSCVTSYFTEKGKAPAKAHDKDDASSPLQKAATKKRSRDNAPNYSLKSAMEDLGKLSEKSDNLMGAKFDRANDSFM